MIKVNRRNIEIEGKENILCAELGMIFNALYEELGEETTKTMINMALDVVIEENRKTPIIKKKELKNKIKEDLPKELADILCSLI